jgi:hypothetical protein
MGAYIPWPSFNEVLINLSVAYRSWGMPERRGWKHDVLKPPRAIDCFKEGLNETAKSYSRFFPHGFFMEVGQGIESRSGCVRFEYKNDRDTTLNVKIYGVFLMYFFYLRSLFHSVILIYAFISGIP